MSNPCPHHVKNLITPEWCPACNTQDQAREAREWWLDTNQDHYYDETDENLIASGFVRVIEYSAFKELKAKVQSLETRLACSDEEKFLASNDCYYWTSAAQKARDQMAQDLARASAENERLRKEYDDYIDGRSGSWYISELKKERDELRAQLQSLYHTTNNEKEELRIALDKAREAQATARAEVEEMKDVYYDIVKMCEASGTEDVRVDLQGILHEREEERQRVRGLSEALRVISAPWDSDDGSMSAEKAYEHIAKEALEKWGEKE